jgi:hypothetical protein
MMEDRGFLIADGYTVNIKNAQPANRQAGLKA